MINFKLFYNEKLSYNQELFNTHEFLKFNLRYGCPDCVNYRCIRCGVVGYTNCKSGKLILNIWPKVDYTCDEFILMCVL